MSWLEKVEKGITITTGDGRKYTPEYFLTPKTTDFNIAEFNFPNVEGTLVKRGTVKGAKHNLTFVFQGENHLDVSFNFEKSAKDNRPWEIEHPFYGIIRVHPTSLTYDSTGINITYELDDRLLIDDLSGEDNIVLQGVNKTNANIYSADVPITRGPNVCLLKGTLVKTQDKYVPIEDLQVGDLVLNHKHQPTV